MKHVKVKNFGRKSYWLDLLMCENNLRILVNTHTPECTLSARCCFLWSIMTRGVQVFPSHVKRQSLVCTLSSPILLNSPNSGGLTFPWMCSSLNLILSNPNIMRAIYTSGWESGFCSLYGPYQPKLRWEDSVDQDIRILGVKNWKKVALNRDEWAKLLKKARAHQGLSS
jgi:hypothetical protein